MQPTGKHQHQQENKDEFKIWEDTDEADAANRPVPSLLADGLHTAKQLKPLIINFNLALLCVHVYG